MIGILNKNILQLCNTAMFACVFFSGSQKRNKHTQNPKGLTGHREIAGSPSVAGRLRVWHACFKVCI